MNAAQIWDFIEFLGQYQTVGEVLEFDLQIHFIYLVRATITRRLIKQPFYFLRRCCLKIVCSGKYILGRTYTSKYGSSA